MEKVGIGVVGLRFGRVIVKSLLESEAARFFDVKFICDLDRNLAEQVSRSYGNLPVARDLDTALSDPSVGAVALMTPPAGRAALIRKIVASDRHVMTTKPFERSADEAERALEEARTRGVAVHLNSPSIRSTPHERQIREWADQYDLGRVIGCRADLWAYKPHPADGSWYDDRDACPVAPVYRIGIYLLNEMIDLLGEPESVTVLHSRILTGRPTPDNGQVGVRFANGALGNVFASFCVADGQDHRHAMTLNFERGTVYANVAAADTPDPEAVTDLRLFRDSSRRWRPETLRILTPSRDSYDWEAFYNAVHGSDIADDGYRNRILSGIRVVEAMARAEKSGCVEKVR